MQWATSLAEAVRTRASALRLRRSTELLCDNLMCEKVGQTCVCKLSMALERMKQLEHLDLSDNHLDRLPEVWRLEKLRTLDVRSNRLETLPEQLALAPALRELRVEGNPLRGVPAALAEMVAAGETAARREPAPWPAPAGGAS
ncbi:hypothetical protein AB1Y20_021900 [Prymnesium parvum]|uniref:Leucine-rich repeat-containing protein 51 n=1 Tax=Prymnesium parvum TaxID=97485 RepID=A0AB34JFJ2_PRYPA|eukprot:CAMPEP_0113276402 /NCGR_PEP_ID=MMETSP0008_2-20120614/25471_1 /TAXON_ID=97485 /ORGANISM="Prymnesium parvum" /LENGTH=142 /DNA_ID=CAMNT_0000126195 /DNA_START=1 /DNA_END=429 /DNA_ORIENTATION=+ /assembly_acc=CAM_ASM_000153